MSIEIGTTKSFAGKATFLFWGDPGVGKTTLAQTIELPALLTEAGEKQYVEQVLNKVGRSEDVGQPVRASQRKPGAQYRLLMQDSRLLYVAADPGQLALRNREFTCAKVSGPNFIYEIYEHIKANQDKYDWVFFDGLNEAGETIIRAEQKKQAGLPNPNRWEPFNKLDEIFYEWVWAMVKNLKPNMVFVTHRECDPKRDRSLLPLFPGNAFKDKLLGIFDEVGYMRVLPAKDNQPARRVIQFQPEVDPRCEVKDRSGALLALEEPDMSVIFNKIYNQREAK